MMRIDVEAGLARLPGFALASGLGLVALLSFATPAVASITGTRTSGFAYDATSGLLTQEVVEPGNAAYTVTTTYTYDAYGNKIAATVTGGDIATRTTSTTYDTKGEFQTGATNALGQGESWTYNVRGEPLTHTGPNGLTTSWAYDAFGRKTLETRPDGTKTAFAYLWCSGVNGGTATCPALASYLVSATPYAPDGATQNGPEAISYYDGLDRAVATDVQGFDGSTVRSATQYDAYGRVQQASKPYFLAGGTPKWVVNAYDALGRVIQTTLPDGSSTMMAYHGLTTIATNAKGQTKTETKNAQGLLASVTDAIGKTITYAYDAFGNLIATTDQAGNVITASYDTAGRKTATHDPDLGDWSYTYDVLGELKTQTDAKGQVTTLTYDLLGRVTERVEPDLTSNWVYDTAPMGVGKLASVSTDHGYSRSEFYDGQGRPSQTSTTILGDTETISTYYDANGRVSLIGYPSGFTAQYDYTGLGYLADLKDANSSQVYWTANAYDASMNLTQATAGNGVVTNQSFDPDTGFLTGIQAGPSNNIANFAYAYDSLSNLTSRSDATQSLTESFEYDSLNRITQYAIVGGATKTVAYDDLGNITSKSDIGAYSYNASGPSSIRPHAVASISPSGTGTTNTSFAYDANGNMVSGNGRTTTWTAANMVASITQGTTVVSFDYDADHVRMREVTASNTTLYVTDPGSGLKIEKVTGAGGAVQWNEYLMAAGQMIGEHFTNIAGGVATTSTRYFVADNLGSIAVITDESGAVVERLSYDAWGKRRYPTGADDPTGSIRSQTTRGFTGHEMIDDVGLVNMNGRVYDPAIGRFMSADPFVQDATDTQSLNRYSYVRNNPLALVDPTGFSWLSHLVTSFLSPLGPIGQIFPGVGRWFDSYVRGHEWAQIAGYVAASTCPAWSVFACEAAAGGYMAGINGGSVGDIVKGAAISAATAYLSSEIGRATNGDFYANGLNKAGQSADQYVGTIDYFENIAGHAALGCAAAYAGGGQCGPQAFAGAVTGATGPEIASTGYYGGLAAAVTIGGTASVLGGGKFADGAKTAAYAYIFNIAVHSRGPAACGTIDQCGARVVATAVTLATFFIPFVGEADALEFLGLDADIARTFEGGQYIARTTSEDIVVYRAEGTQFGRWFGTVEPKSAAEAELMYNVVDYGNDLTTVSSYKIPTGTTIYEGPVAGGTGTQIYVPEPTTSGVELLGTKPLPQGGF